MSRFLKFLGRLIAKLAGLPDVIAKWRQIIPIDKVMAYIAEAETISNLSGEDKRKYAAKRLAKWAASKGYLIPESVINFLIEEAFQLWLKQTGNQPPEPPVLP